MSQSKKFKSPDRQTHYNIIVFAVRYVKYAIESSEGCLHKAFWNVKYYNKYYVKRSSKKKK